MLPSTKVKAELAAEREAAAAANAGAMPQPEQRKHAANGPYKAARMNRDGDGDRRTALSSGDTKAASPAVAAGREAPQANGAAAVREGKAAGKKRKQQKGTTNVADSGTAYTGPAAASLRSDERDPSVARPAQHPPSSKGKSQRPEKGEGKGGGEAAAQAALKRKMKKMKQHQALKR